ncbi:hypothetical protein C5167_036524 [Papaver somniferum]|uniref:Uncharacterized protein n=1 Tax=Papaver somniferum TaxID=3469 RepID=A0A4Y7I6X3_PAPSO|nr:hypothetical protein C5167_036524 [Papaver somniferum]
MIVHLKPMDFRTTRRKLAGGTYLTWRISSALLERQK